MQISMIERDCRIMLQNNLLPQSRFRCWRCSSKLFFSFSPFLFWKAPNGSQPPAGRQSRSRSHLPAGGLPRSSQGHAGVPPGGARRFPLVESCAPCSLAPAGLLPLAPATSRASGLASRSPPSLRRCCWSSPPLATATGTCAPPLLELASSCASNRKTFHWS
jgi:hypothetical protein